MSTRTLEYYYTIISTYVRSRYASPKSNYQQHDKPSGGINNWHSQPGGGTQLVAGIDEFIETFGKNNSKNKAVVIITDGQSTAQEHINFIRKFKEHRLKPIMVNLGGGKRYAK